MRMIIGTFVSLILILYITFISIESINANQGVNTANKFQSSCIESIEYSNFSLNVINQWSEKAKEYGYDLKIVDLSVSKDNIVIPCYYVTLTYNTRINLLGIKKESSIKGYAR